MATTVHETDVLIIGGGGGGMYAAINAADMGAKVIIVSKALMGRGGCSSTFGYVGANPPQQTRAVTPVDSTANTSFHDNTEVLWPFSRRPRICEKSIVIHPDFLSPHGKNGTLLPPRRRRHDHQLGPGSVLVRWAPSLAILARGLWISCAAKSSFAEFRCWRRARADADPGGRAGRGRDRLRLHPRHAA